MKILSYDANAHSLATLGRCFLDSVRVNTLGFPRLAGNTGEALARESLRRNAHGVLWAGTGHFRVMWVSDFAKALRGAYAELDAGYLSGLITMMTREAAKRGYVPACYAPGSAFDIPWPRGDGMPWLLHAHAVRLEKTGRAPSAEETAQLQSLLATYEATHFDGPLISRRVTGDWVDTIKRPSSTYNNVCALHMLKLARALGLKTVHAPEAMEEALLGTRLREYGLTDYDGAEVLSVDAGVLALYLELFSRQIRERLAAGLEACGAAEPLPIRCAVKPHESSQMPILTWFSSGYHQSVWLHLGLMYLNGLKKLGRNVEARRKAVEAVFLRHGNVMEAVRPDGRPYRGVFLSCEHGLSMAAGQYLELLR